MAVYYNEIDPFAAAWLRSLIAAGHIPDGDVDERSIANVQPMDLKDYAQCHFFAGIGGWSHALRLAGWPDDRPIWTGSCPCQPFSVAGRGKGKSDERHLWPVFHQLITQCRPPVIMGEQVASAAGYDWFDDVANDMESAGYAARAVDIPACSVGALHKRHRLYWIATDTKRDEQSRQKSCGGKIRRMGRQQQPVAWNRSWKSTLSSFRTLDDGFPRCVGATDAARNAIVPPLAAEVIKAFMDA